MDNFVPRIVLRRIRNVDQSTLDEIVLLLFRGAKVRVVSEFYGIPPRTIYNWKKQVKACVTAHKAEFTEKVAPARSYYYYIQKEYRKGHMDKKQRNKALNVFYANRDNPHVGTNTTL